MKYDYCLLVENIKFLLVEGISSSKRNNESTLSNIATCYHYEKASRHSTSAVTKLPLNWDAYTKMLIYFFLSLISPTHTQYWHIYWPKVLTPFDGALNYPAIIDINLWVSLHWRPILRKSRLLAYFGYLHFVSQSDSQSLFNWQFYDTENCNCGFWQSSLNLE